MAKGGNAGRPIGSGGKETGGLHRLGVCVVALFVTMGITLLPQTAAETISSPLAAAPVAAVLGTNTYTVDWTFANGFTASHGYNFHLHVTAQGNPDPVSRGRLSDEYARLSITFYLTGVDGQRRQLCISRFGGAASELPQAFYDCDGSIPYDAPVGRVTLGFYVRDLHRTWRYGREARGWVTETSLTGGLAGGYTPINYMDAYDIRGDATGQTIGIVLAGSPVSQSDLDAFSRATGVPHLREGSSGPDTVHWNTITPQRSHEGANEAGVRELAADVEYAHAMAWHSHLEVWLVPILQSKPNQGKADVFSFPMALDAAVKKGVKIVSNSWGLPSWNSKFARQNRQFYQDLENVLHNGRRKGVSFFFGSGDFGALSGCDVPPMLKNCPIRRGTNTHIPAPMFPAESPDVIAVGGTSLDQASNPSSASGYQYSETAWGKYFENKGCTTFFCLGGKHYPHGMSSGGGCSLHFGHPSWQDNLPHSICAYPNHRLIPDVAAAASEVPKGAFIQYWGHAHAFWGTSLATPLWAGMVADLERYLFLHHKPATGFIAPKLYSLARLEETYKRDFRDIVAYAAPGNFDGIDSSGFQPEPYWDEVTGLGSPDLAHLEQDWAATDGRGTLPSAASASSVPDTGAPGDAVTIIGKEFDPRQMISLSLCAGIQPACEASVSLHAKGSVRSDNQGAFAARTVIPAQANTLTGAHFFIQAKVSGVQALATGGTEIRAKTAAYAQFNLRPSTPTSMPTNTPNGCPRSWTCQDIGSPHVTGTQVLTTATESVTWTVQGAGGIGNSADIFHYVWQSLRGDGTARARLIGVTRSGQYESAQESVMLRASSDPGAPYYSAVSNGNDIVSVDYRDGQGHVVQHQELLYHRGPVYFGVSRVGATFTTYTSDDGARWAPLNGSRITLAAMGVGSTVEAGLAVASNSAGFLSTATFDHVSLGHATFAPVPNTCPHGWTCQDIGAGWPGTQAPPTAADGITWTVQGAGLIGGTADIFHYVWRPLAGDATVNARIIGVTRSGQYESAQAGVMLRASSDPGAPYYFAYSGGADIVVVDYRDGLGHAGQRLVLLRPRDVPVYLRVDRRGRTFTAYTSNDGATWTLLNGSRVTLTAVGHRVEAGLAVASNSAGFLSTATFDHVSVSS